MTIALSDYRISDGPDDCDGFCAFGQGTLIATTDGDLPVDWLAAGDLVITRDHGAQRLRWVGHTRLTARQLAETPALRPVLVEPGSFGSGAPEHPLAVSRRHRIFVDGPDVQYYFGTACALAGAERMAEVNAGYDGKHGYTYFHLLFDRHEVVLANGLWAESMFADPAAKRLAQIKGAPPQPDIRHAATAHRCLTEWEAQLLHQIRNPGRLNVQRRAA